MLKDKAVIITGASYGMGQSMAELSAEEGAAVVITARHQEKLDAVNKTAKYEAPENPYAYTVLQNLKDAGCTDEMAEKFMTLQNSHDKEQQLQLLSRHRKHLLEKLHREEKQIDCLDYLIYQIQKKK